MTIIVLDDLLKQYLCSRDISGSRHAHRTISRTSTATIWVQVDNSSAPSPFKGCAFLIIDDRWLHLLTILLPI